MDDEVRVVWERGARRRCDWVAGAGPLGPPSTTKRAARRHSTGVADIVQYVHVQGEH